MKKGETVHPKKISSVGDYSARNIKDIYFGNAVVRYSEDHFAWIAPGGKQIFEPAEALALAKRIDREIKQHEANRQFKAVVV